MLAKQNRARLTVRQTKDSMQGTAPNPLMNFLPPELLQQLPPDVDPAQALQSAMASLPPQLQSVCAQMMQSGQMPMMAPQQQQPMQQPMPGMPAMPGMQAMPGMPPMPGMPAMPGMPGMPPMPGMPGMVPQGAGAPGGVNPFAGGMPPELQQIMQNLTSGAMPKGSMVALSFNNMMIEFLKSLHTTFPERSELELALKGMDIAVKIDPMEPLRGWQRAMAKFGECSITVNGKKEKLKPPYFAERTEERQAVFLEQAPHLPFIEMIPIVEMWSDPDIDEQDRQDAWDHLHQLELIALTINAFDTNTLGAIERVAGRCMHKIAAMGSDAQNLDLKTLGMDVVREMMSDNELKEAMEKAEKKDNSSESGSGGGGSGGLGGFSEQTLLAMLQGPLGQRMGLDNVNQFRGADGQFDPSAFANQFAPQQ